MASSSKKKRPAMAIPKRSPSESPKIFEFNLGAFNIASSSKKKKNVVASSSVLMQPTGPAPNIREINTVADLKEMASSRLDSIKRQIDRSHSEILKDKEASQTRLHKRFRIQTQACQHVMDETEKEYKKLSQQISESREAMKASYVEFLAEAQGSSSRVCKTSIPELSQSFENALDALRNRYGIPSTVQ
ncbi:hypothetical protein U1Q18_048730 [Sarracenia purpurea var. burkii]